MADPRLHIIATTADVIRKDGRFLILKRAAHEVAFPGKWAPPGGKIVRHEYESVPKDQGEYWHQVAEMTLRKEIREEAGVEVSNLHYYDNWVFIRPDDIPVLMLNFWTQYKSGRARPGKDFDEVAWATPEEMKKFDIIEGLDERLAKTRDKLRKTGAIK